MNTTEETAKTPEWMLLLENKRKRLHRLAHEIGAGAPCLSCGDACPGLDLHFWRKLCRNCKCKKEEHDVRDDEGYEQFEILFANSNTGKKKRTGAFLNIKVPETSASVTSSVGVGTSIGSSTTENKKGIAFDWVPPDVPEEVAAEYMQQLPPSKLPISGSDGALYRRQQLEKQVPLHDLDATKCHGLTADEIQGLQQYLENLKNNVVGQGRVTKLPVLYTEKRVSCSAPTQHQVITIAQSSITGESRPLRIASSQSAQCLRSLPSIPLPRPYATQNYDKNDPNSFPPPPPTSPDSVPPNATNLDLKTPSAFLPSSHYNILYQGSSVDVQMPLKEGLASSTLPHTWGTSTEDQKKFKNVPHSAQFSGIYSGHVGDAQTLTHARDGTFVSEQQAHEIAYSTQMPVGLVSQHSNVLDISKETSQGTQNSQHPSNDNSNVAARGGSTIPPVHTPSTRVGVITTFGQQSGISFSADTKTQNAQTSEPLSFVNAEQQSSFHSFPSNSDIAQESSVAEHPSNVSKASGHSVSHADNLGAFLPQDATFMPYATNISGQVVHSIPIAGDSMPKSARVMQQNHLDQQEEPQTIDLELAGKLEHLTGIGDGSLQPEDCRLNCYKCNQALLAGQVAVLAERAGKQAAWHPQCFVCCTCKELLVDLIYFYHKGDVFCGRHYAELLNIPRCFACDELIFVKEYTCAEGKAFHVKHFCCLECDIPLGGKQYIPKDNQPICLECFQNKYGKSCHTCKRKIAAGDQRVGWKDLSWHVSPHCFCCSQCSKSLLGGKFLVKNEQPFCSKECAQSAALI